MSENLENVQQVEQTQTEPIAEQTENTEQTDTADAKSVDTAEQVSDEKSSDESKLEELFSMIRTIVENRDNIIKDLNDRREYLINNLTDYDTEDYLKNEAFQSLYSHAFNALGTNLDTPKFIELVDNYVNSRIEQNNRRLAAQKENESLTDSLEFRNGVSKKPEKKFRFQDIPPEELEKYIALYV